MFGASIQVLSYSTISYGHVSSISDIRQPLTSETNVRLYYLGEYSLLPAFVCATTLRDLQNMVDRHVPYLCCDLDNDGGAI